MAVKTRAQLKSENAADFPDNTTRLISPADLRGQMDDVIDSAVFPEDGSGGSASVSNLAYDATTWNDVVDVAPSQNAVRDKIESLVLGGGGGASFSVTSRTAMAALNAATYNNAAYLTEAGREGLFRWAVADFSTLVTADAQQGLYVAPAAPTGFPTNGSGGAWVRQHDGRINIRWFGALGTYPSPDSSTADAAAWTSFNNWLAVYVGPVTMVIPPSAGTYRPTGQILVAGVGKSNDITVEAIGAKVEPAGVAPVTTWSNFSYTVHPPKILSAYVGATTITLIPADAARISEFTVGRMVSLHAFDMSAEGGYPPNNQYFEYNRVLSIDAPTATITLSKALINNYLSTYPDLHSTSGPGMGPATIMQTVPEWDRHIIFKGGQNTNSARIYGAAREITWIDWTNPPTGGGATVPTVALRVTYIRHRFTGGGEMEVDKLVSELNYEDCNIDMLRHQSTSIDRVSIKGGEIQSLPGTPKNIRLESTVVRAMAIGTNHGATSSVQANDSYIANTQHVLRGFPLTYFVSTTGGILKMNKATAPSGGAAAINSLLPGTWGFLTVNGFAPNCGVPFRVTDVYTEGTSPELYCVVTTLPDPIPNMDFVGSATDYIGIHPCPQISARGCTGAQLWKSLSLSPFGALPMHSYYNTGQIHGPVPTHPVLTQIMWGRLERLRINIIKPYTGTGALTLRVMGQYGATKFNMPFASGLVAANYVPYVNAKTAGMREVVKGTVTGAVAGDTLAVPATDMWFVGAFTPDFDVALSANSGEWPVWQIEMITEQRV